MLPMFVVEFSLWALHLLNFLTSPGGFRERLKASSDAPLNRMASVMFKFSCAYLSGHCSATVGALFRVYCMEPTGPPGWLRLGGGGICPREPSGSHGQMAPDHHFRKPLRSTSAACARNASQGSSGGPATNHHLKRRGFVPLHRWGV